MCERLKRERPCVNELIFWTYFSRMPTSHLWKIIYSLYVTTRKSHWLLRNERFFQNAPYSASVSRGSYQPHLSSIPATKTGWPSSSWPPMTAPWGIPDWRLFGTELNVVPSASSYTRICNIKTTKIGKEFLLASIIRGSTNETNTNVSLCYQII